MPNAVVKVLMIEDDKFLCELAKEQFTKEGFQTICAMEGESGVHLAEKELPDIILLDILLPGLDGFEVLKHIRANPSLKKTRVIMLSNFAREEEREKARQLGADLFLTKAEYTLDKIVGVMREVLTPPKK